MNNQTYRLGKNSILFLSLLFFSFYLPNSFSPFLDKGTSSNYEDEDTSASSDNEYSGSVTSNDGYTVHIEVEIDDVDPASESCNWGYNYTLELEYDITFSGQNIPNSLYTLQGTVGCGASSIFFNLPNDGGDGDVDSSNAWTSNTDCDSASPESLGCNSIIIQIEGPGLSSTYLTLNADEAPAVEDGDNTISGRIYRDLNEDGQYDSGSDQPQGAVRVILYNDVNSNQEYDSGTDTYVDEYQRIDICF